MRIDHLRGFAGYWEILVSCPTAIHGRRVPAPGQAQVWPRPWWRILFSSYPELALEFDTQSGTPLPSRLEAHGIAEQAFGRDFYQPILETLTRHGGYVRSEPWAAGEEGRAPRLCLCLRLGARSTAERACAKHFTQQLDPSAPQHEDSFLPVAYPFFLCEHHSQLTGNINFQDNLLNVLLTRQLPWENERSDARP